MNETTLEQWAVVDLFGHQRIAGKVSEQTFGSGALVRVDVPECGDRPGFTRLFGNGAIYSISFVDEALARKVAATLRPEPVQPYELESLRPRQGQIGFRDDEDDRG